MKRVWLIPCLILSLLLVGSLWQLALITDKIVMLENRLSSLSEEIVKNPERVNKLTERVVIMTTTVVVTSTDVNFRQLSVSEIYDMVKDSVVMISIAGRSVGSGFVYSEEGYIVTNEHVVEAGSYYSVVFLDRSTFRAVVVGRDPYSDIAVLKLEGLDGFRLKPLRLGNSSELRVGERIIAVGSPFGLAGTLTTGVVSQKGRILPTVRGFSIPGVIQIDAAINPGNSGGPLLNMRGEVIGITTAIESPTGGFVGIGYAIPSNIIRRVAQALIERGSYQHSWLGIRGTNMDSEIAKAMGTNVYKGVLIIDIVEGSPAAKAGLRPGNREVIIDRRSLIVGGDIITAIDGQRINSIEELLTYLEEKTSPGDEVKLTIIRENEEIEIELILEPRPPP